MADAQSSLSEPVAALGPPARVLAPPFQISLNSQNAIQKNSTYENECLFQLPPTFAPERQAFRLRVKGFTIPVSWYQMNSTNNTLLLTYGGINYTVTIADGNYSTNTFPTVFAAAVAAATGGTITCVLDGYNNKWTFTGGAAFVFRSVSEGTTMFGFLGFPTSPRTSTTTYASSGGVRVSTIGVDFSGNNSVFIVSTLLSNNVQSFSSGGSGGASKYIARVPVQTQFTGILDADPQAFQETQLSDRQISRFVVTLLDENLNLLQCTLPWTLNLDINFAWDPARSRDLFPKDRKSEKRKREKAGMDVEDPVDEDEPEEPPPADYDIVDEEAAMEMDEPLEEPPARHADMERLRQDAYDTYAERVEPRWNVTDALFSNVNASNFYGSTVNPFAPGSLESALNTDFRANVAGGTNNASVGPTNPS